MANQLSEGGRNDRERLATFVIDTRKVLLLFVEYREALLPSYMQDNFYHAWPQVDEVMHDTVGILKGEVSSYTLWPYLVDIEYPSEHLDRLLKMFGLTGQ